MSKVTTLASGQINGQDLITVELVEANETPAVVIVTWPAKPSVFHPRRFRVIRPADHDSIRAGRRQAQLEAIRSRLIGQAERDLAKAERYQHSKRPGERNSAPIRHERKLLIGLGEGLIILGATVGYFNLAKTISGSALNSSCWR